MPKMADTYKNRILVKRAQMLALTNKYNRAMSAGQREIEKIAAEYQTKQAAYRKVISGLKGLRKEAQQTTASSVVKPPSCFSAPYPRKPAASIPGRRK